MFQVNNNHYPKYGFVCFLTCGLTLKKKKCLCFLISKALFNNRITINGSQAATKNWSAGSWLMQPDCVAVVVRLLCLESDSYALLHIFHVSYAWSWSGQYAITHKTCPNQHVEALRYLAFPQSHIAAKAISLGSPHWSFTTPPHKQKHYFNYEKLFLNTVVIRYLHVFRQCNLHNLKKIYTSIN